MNKFTAVWADDLEEELAAVDRCLSRFPMVSFDTEFPGFLRNTPRNASEGLRYEDLKYNVDSLKIIQLGLTLFDDRGNVGGTWEFNFRSFDEKSDPHVATSISLLKSNGLDLEKFGKFGIDSEGFAEGFVEVLRMHRCRLQWVSFHGLYDSAYVLKVVTRKAMPSSVTEFAKLAGLVFERVYDVKFMARYCPGLLGGEIGLERMAKILQVERSGGAHQAGSDSLLTAQVFVKLRTEFGLKAGMYEGFLYALSPKIIPCSNSAASVHRAPPHVILVPVGSTGQTMLHRRLPYRTNPAYSGARPILPVVYPSPPPLFMPAQPLCNGFPAALPQAPPQFYVQM